MVGSLIVRGVPDDLIARLKARAQANGRSAESEHRELLRDALMEDRGALFDELAAQMRALTAGRIQTPSEDLIREMRDSR